MKGKKFDCFECKGLCCKVPKFREIYFPHELDTMRGRVKLFEAQGKHVEVRKKFSGLLHIVYVLAYSPCQHLDEKGLCKIHEKRPKDFPCIEAVCPFETGEEPEFWKIRKAMVKKFEKKK